jgi:hypothetical protein
MYIVYYFGVYFGLSYFVDSWNNITDKVLSLIYIVDWWNITEEFQTLTYVVDKWKELKKQCKNLGKDNC